MILQGARARFRKFLFVVGQNFVTRRSENGLMIVNQDAVLKDGDVGGPDQFMILIPTRALKDDIVALPITGDFANVNQGQCLAINRSALAVGVGRVIIAIKHLDFEYSVKENAAVATFLTVTDDVCRFRPFDVQLKIAEFFLGVDIAAFRHAFHVIAMNYPLGKDCQLFRLSQWEKSEPLKRTNASAGGEARSGCN